MGGKKTNWDDVARRDRMRDHGYEPAGPRPVLGQRRKVKGNSSEKIVARKFGTTSIASVARQIQPFLALHLLKLLREQKVSIDSIHAPMPDAIAESLLAMFGVPPVRSRIRKANFPLRTKQEKKKNRVK